MAKECTFVSAQSSSLPAPSLGMAMLDSQAFWELMVDSAPLSVTAADSTTYYSQDLPMHASAWNTETYIPPAVADVGMSAAPSSAVAYMNTQQAALWSSNTWSAPQQAVDYTRYAADACASTNVSLPLPCCIWVVHSLPPYCGTAGK